MRRLRPEVGLRHSPELHEDAVEEPGVAEAGRGPAEEVDVGAPVPEPGSLRRARSGGVGGGARRGGGVTRSGGRSFLLDREEVRRPVS